MCNNDRFTPDSAVVACRALGYDGGAALRFRRAFRNPSLEISISPVRT